VSFGRPFAICGQAALVAATSPATLGYGSKGSPPAIPSEATLVFVIDLLGT